jgi:hypothetical protein
LNCPLLPSSCAPSAYVAPRSRLADSTRPPNDYLTGILEVTRFINFIFKADVSTYYPPSLEQAGVNPDLVRYGLVEHLVSVAIDVLGEEAFSKTLPFKDNMVLGAGKNGSPTSAGQSLLSLSLVLAAQGLVLMNEFRSTFQASSSRASSRQSCHLSATPLSLERPSPRFSPSWSTSASRVD